MVTKTIDDTDQVELVKKTIIRSIYGNDNLMDYLVVKGGNAIAYVHQIVLRQSIDVDFSLAADYLENQSEEQLAKDLKDSLDTGFDEVGYHFFDFKFEKRPKEISKLGEFWGGYGVTFKIISNQNYQLIRQKKLPTDKELETLRRNAIEIGGSTKIEIDISRAEITQPKIEVDIEGLTVYAYSTEMIIAEKLRAICQQMDEYSPIIQRNRKGNSRAKDFFDIYLLCNQFNIDMSLPDNINLIKQIFAIKKVPLYLLDLLSEYKNLHEDSFQSVKSTVVTSESIHDFDFYFNYVENLYKKSIKPNL